MILKVLGSSSAGNCYIMENDGEALILEAGIRFSEVKRALNYNVKKIAGCLITHEHKDHARYVNEFLKDAVNVYASEGTSKKIAIKGNRYPIIIGSGNCFLSGNFKIIPFDAKHDAAEPLGFFINHRETGNILFATDTYYLPCTFSGLSNIIIECNYRLDILEENTRNGSISATQRNRIIQSHMSYDTCLKTLLANDLSKVNNIVLIHLSNDNSNAHDFQEGIRKATGKTIHVADRGIIIPFNKTPF